MGTAFKWRRCHRATMSPGIIHQDLQHLRGPGLQDRAGHPGGTDQQLQPNDYDRYQDHLPGLLSQQVGIQCGVLAVNYSSVWRRAGGSG